MRFAAAVVAGLVALTGCGFKGAYSLPLPGGAAHGKTYHVTAYFADVQDLTVQAAVRVNDVAVGDVTSIKIDTDKTSPNFLRAAVGMSINQSVKLPANAVATLEQTTLLGEKFVALSPPTNTAPEGTLADNAVISYQKHATSELPSVEEVFGLLSQVLNGSDLADLQTINVEVSKALAGREQAVQGALKQLNTFVGGLNDQKHQIVRALDELNRFSGALAKQNGTIATALTDLGPGLKVLADERAQFTALLQDLSKFGKVATHIIRASKQQTIQGFKDLQPILHHLAAAGKALPHSLEILITFPFPRDSSQASPGDFTNFQARLNLTPILCSAFANFNLTDLYNLLTDPNGPGGLIGTLLGGQKCPKTRSVSNLSRALKLARAGTPPSSAASGSAGSAQPGGTARATPSKPAKSGLIQLLAGLLGGGKR
jgi:phospholipid/cholesterol/gamma-HCH transport system substrate-binding protein